MELIWTVLLWEVNRNHRESWSVKWDILSGTILPLIMTLNRINKLNLHGFRSTETYKKFFKKWCIKGTKIYLNLLKMPQEKSNRWTTTTKKIEGENKHNGRL